MKKLASIVLFMALCLTSCGDDDDALTTGQRIISELQSVIAENNVVDVGISRAGFGWNGSGSSDFSFQNESIRVDDRYYNINRLTEYRVDSYTKNVNGQDFEIVVLILTMDI